MASSSSTTEAAVPWTELPRDITASILLKLGAIEILSTAQRVCTAWRSVCQDPSTWQCIDMRNTGNLWEIPLNLEEMCCDAVDRSQGGLIDINIEYFGTDELLIYISRRSSQLKRLQLVFCSGITSDVLIQAVGCFPLLEELHLYYTDIEEEAIEAIGRSCPQLKSFKLNKRWRSQLYFECDMEAQAIAQNMPELRHLQLLGNKMTNEGLRAILDGCLHLESLDLRQCFNIHLTGSIGRLCKQRIRDLRRPHDSTRDYLFVADDSDSSDDDHLTGYSDMDTVSDYNDHMEFSSGSVCSYDSYNDHMEFSSGSVSSYDSGDWIQ